MPSPNATPTPITPPRVPLIDPRTGLIDRAWYLFFLSLLNAATIVDDGNLGADPISLIASYDAALQALAQNVDTQPPPVDLSAELIKQIEAAGLTDQSLALLSQIAEMQKQIDALNASPNLRPPSVSDVSGLGTMAIQNADAVAITGGTINNTVIGGTTPAAGTFTTLIGGGGSANFFQTQGAATTKAVEVKALGSDTNIAFVIDSKGTGAIDLAAGSSGVNISNGGTVTAITRTTTGSAYTSFPSVAITAPTTAGGVQATATVATMVHVSSTVQSGGTGYTVNDVLTVVGGTPTASAATMTVTAVSGGVITAATPLNFGQYTVLPTNPVSVTGGTGSGATFNLFWGIGSNPSFTITNAGSGYVEQPTVSFSGGGGSGAAAYATVGSVTTIKSIGASTTGTTLASIQFVTPNTANPNYPPLTIRDIANSDTGLIVSPNTGYAQLFAGNASNSILMLGSAGTSSIYFNTQGSSQTNQLRVAHTASAVNYVQVTGAATGSGVAISSQGSDTSVGLVLQAKGSSGTIGFGNASGLNNQAFRVSTGTATNTGNLILVTGAASGSSPSISAISGTGGSDTNIDLALTPKGTGKLVVTNGIQGGTF